MKLFLTAGCGQKVEKPAVHAQLCRRGKWALGPKSIHCEVNAWANTRWLVWVFHEIKTWKSHSYAHKQVSFFSSHGVSHEGVLLLEED